MFNGAQKTKFSEIGSSPYCQTTLKRLQANTDPRIRNTTLSSLLHPLKRSCRVGSILGRRLHKRVFDDLETFQLTQDEGNIPQVIGIYALQASRITALVAGDSLKDPAYVGKAGTVTPDNAGSIPMPRRAMAIETEDQLEWPSDDTRYKALSSTLSSTIEGHVTLLWW